MNTRCPENIIPPEDINLAMNFNKKNTHRLGAAAGTKFIIFLRFSPDKLHKFE